MALRRKNEHNEYVHRKTNAMNMCVAKTSAMNMCIVKTNTINISAWKSSLGTAKRPGLDWTLTSQDRKFPRPSKTATAVQSSVSQDFGNFKTDERLVLTGSTSLSTQNPT